jgi:hypothetical protein
MPRRKPGASWYLRFQPVLQFSHSGSHGSGFWDDQLSSQLARSRSYTVLFYPKCCKQDYLGDGRLESCIQESCMELMAEQSSQQGMQGVGREQRHEPPQSSAAQAPSL